MEVFVETTVLSVKGFLLAFLSLCLLDFGFLQRLGRRPGGELGVGVTTLFLITWQRARLPSRGRSRLWMFLDSLHQLGRCLLLSTRFLEV